MDKSEDIFIRFNCHYNEETNICTDTNDCLINLFYAYYGSSPSQKQYVCPIALGLNINKNVMYAYLNFLKELDDDWKNKIAGLL